MTDTTSPTLNDLYSQIKEKEYVILQELKLLVDAFNAELNDLLSDSTGGNTAAAQYFARIKSTISYTLGQDLTNILAQYTPATISPTPSPVAA
jgi:hypothetical protein